MKRSSPREDLASGSGFGLARERIKLLARIERTVQGFALARTYRGAREPRMPTITC